MRDSFSDHGSTHPNEMNYNGFFGNYAAASGCFQLIPKYKLEVKLIKNKHPNIFAGNKSENGSQPLNFHFFRA